MVNECDPAANFDTYTNIATVDVSKSTSGSHTLHRYDFWKANVDAHQKPGFQATAHFILLNAIKEDAPQMR